MYKIKEWTVVFGKFIKKVKQDKQVSVAGGVAARSDEAGVHPLPRAAVLLPAPAPRDRRCPCIDRLPGLKYIWVLQ